MASPEAIVGPHKLPTQQTARLEVNASFLRASRAGHIDIVLRCLDDQGADINACNPNGLNALHLASKEGHINIVNELLRRGASVDSATKKGNTSLHIGSLAGHEDIVKTLVQQGAKVNVQSQTGFTPLYMAAQENHVEVVQYLLEHGANQNLSTEDGFTPLSVALQQGHNRVVAILMENDTRNKVRLPALHVAAKKDDVRAATLLLTDDPNKTKGVSNVNEATKSGFTPLHIASHYGSLNVARLLLENKADINYIARNSITPLHVASKWGRVAIVQLLVDNRANLECKTRDSLTPLHCAARSGHDQVVDVLLEKGAMVGAKTKNGLTPLHMAAQGDHTECARILLFHKATIDEVTMDYLTPLHVAAHCGNVKMAKLLLDANCEVNARALNGFTPLHVACKKNRIKVIELLLRYGALIESTTESGLTPLHVASFMGHTSIVTFLLENGAKTETATMRGETALHLAARANQTEVMRLLLRAGANVDAKAKEQQTPLHISSRLGSTEAVTLLLTNGATRDAVTKDNYTPLHIAVKENHEDVVEILLDNGAKHDMTTKKGFTPLHIAAKYGNVPITKILLQKGANPNVEGKNGLTPLHVATHYNNADVAQLLLDSKGNPHATAKNGYTPLHIAAKRDHVEIAKLLLDKKAKPDSESKNGFTPLHLAAQEGHTDIAELLLSRGANVNCKSKNNLTPMHLAAQEDQVPVAEILVKYKSQIDPQTKAGYTPLHTACHFGQLNMIRFLLEHGAAVDAKTKAGYTPLHQAAQQGHVLVINILMKYKASPDVLNENGQTPLSIAQQLGYISVVEILKHVTTVEVEAPTVTDKYKVVMPEIMQEDRMDSDEEAGDDTIPADKSYLSVDSRDIKYRNDPFGLEAASGRHSTLSSIAGRDPFQDEMRYMRDDPDTYGGTLTPSVGGDTMQDEFKYMMHDAESSRHRSETPTDGLHDTSYPADQSERWNGSMTPLGEPEIRQTYQQQQQLAYSPQAYNDDGDKYVYNGDALPVTEAFLKNQMKYGKPVDQSTLQRQRAQSEEASVDEVIAGPEQSQNHYAASPGSDAKIADFDARLLSSLYSDPSIASSFNPDNVSIERNPVLLGFLVSFVVDARGGAMRGCRHSCIRIVVPPGRACAPIRITCKFVRCDKLPNPPPLNDGESLATRVLKMGPVGAIFSGPVMLEVPHYASLRGRERDVAVLRSDNGHTWYEHPIVATDDAVQKCLSGNFEGEELENAEELYQRRVTRIITTDFPMYFALVTRIRQEAKIIGMDGGIISSTVVPQVQAVIPPGAITKGIRVGVQAHPINEELVTKVLGERVSVSPIVTIEPRHRKFHQPIQITIPLPPKSPLRGGKTKPGTGTPTLRLLCSITGGTAQAQWEDITGSNPLTLIDDCVTFTTNISARFWLMDLSVVKDSVPNAIDLYREATVVPFMAKFMLFAKRRNLTEARLRVFCVTDDRMEKTLESQEHFVEIARSRDVEVLEGRRQYVEIAGNMMPVTSTKSGTEHVSVNFRPFRENRLPLLVRIKDLKAEPAGQVLFVPEPVRGPAAESQKPPAPICVLNVALPGVSSSLSVDSQTSENELKDIPLNEALHPSGGMHEIISRADLKLTDIADALQSDWVPLARQLGLTQQEIVSIQKQYKYVSEQGLVVLHLWVEKNRENATGNELERALKKINREDIINKCMHNLEAVTDEVEKQQALAQLQTQLNTDDDSIPILAKSEPAVSAIPPRSSEQAPSAQMDVDPSSQPPQSQDFQKPTDTDISSPDSYVPSSDTDAAADTSNADQFPTGNVDAVPVPESAETTLQIAPQGQGSPDFPDGENYQPQPVGEDEKASDDQNPNAPSLRVFTHTTTGDPQIETNVQETEEVLPDGTIVKHRVTTTQQHQLVSKRIIVEGPEGSLPTNREDAERLIGEMGQNDADNESEDPVVTTDVQEFEETLEDGTVVKRRVVTTSKQQLTTEKVFLDESDDIPAGSSQQQ